MIYNYKLNLVIVNYCLYGNKWFKLGSIDMHYALICVCCAEVASMSKHGSIGAKGTGGVLCVLVRENNCRSSEGLGGMFGSWQRGVPATKFH